MACLLIADLLSIAVGSAAAETIRVTDFGIHPNSSSNASPGLRKAVEAALAHPGAVLVFPKGRYDFWPEGARQLHVFISNHDPVDERAVALALDGARDLTVDGRGSKFVFHGVMLPIAVMGSHKVTLRNFSIDFSDQHLLNTRVENVSDGAVHVKVLPGQNYSVRNGRLTIRAENWSGLARASLEIDPATKAVALHARDNFKLAAATIRQDGDDDLVVTGLPAQPKVGNILLLRAVDRPDPAIWIDQSQQVSAKDITVHAAFGMGLIAQKSEDLHLDHVNVALESNSARLITTNADALHFSNCKGKIIVENGLYENMLDDGINVHGSFLEIERILSPNTLLLRWGHFQTFGFEFARPGDELEFVARSTLLPYWRIRAQQVSEPNEHNVEVSFDNPVPATLHVGDYVSNVAWQPSVVYRRNTVRRIRSRGALFSTTNGVLVEGNTFAQTSAAGVLLPGEAMRWFESTPSRNVILRHNQFRDTNQADPRQAAIVITISAPRLPSQAGYNHSNIEIIDNRFNLLGRHVLDATSVDGLQITGNRLTNARSFVLEGTPVVSLTHTRCVDVGDNFWQSDDDDDTVTAADTKLLTRASGISSAPNDWRSACSSSFRSELTHEKTEVRR